MAEPRWVGGDRNRALTLGVDFGTTYCSAGVCVDGEPQLLIDHGDASIPSIAHFPARGDPVIGADAKRMLVVDPSNTVRSIKRVLGCAFDSSPVRQFSASAAYPLASGPNDSLVLTLARSKYTSEQVVSLFLAHLRDAAETRFAGRVTGLVATVPASANAAYEQALRRAAKLAHLNVLETIPEPVAGALALGVHLEDRNRNLIVCDFGGGTFDATTVAAGHRRLDVLACAGDGFLGGDDLDDELVNGVAGAIFKRASFDLFRDAVRYQRLLQRCEFVKRNLSTKTEVRLRMRDAYVLGRSSCDIDNIIERSWAEQRWSKLFDRAMVVIDGLLERTGWTEADVDQVALIGGTSLVPRFGSLLAERFGPEAVRVDGAAATAVVRGAVLRSSALAPARSR